MARTNPPSQVYPACQQDISDPGVARYINGVHTPSNPKPLTTPSTSLLVALRLLKVMLVILHQILGIFRGFNSPPLGLLQTLGGFLSHKVSPRFSRIQVFFVDS
jgi:hypothetical protein